MADSAPTLPDKLFFRIGEVGRITGVKPYVLRYWETVFPRIRPQKTRSGQRLYRRKDVETVLLVKKLLWDERFTIEGARKRLREVQGPEAVEEEIRGKRTDKRAAELEATLREAESRAQTAEGRAKEAQDRARALEKLVADARKDLASLLEFVSS
jgi:DNA-binding transcriptional MerR regulator